MLSSLTRPLPFKGLKLHLIIYPSLDTARCKHATFMNCQSYRIPEKRARYQNTELHARPNQSKYKTSIKLALNCVSVWRGLKLLQILLKVFTHMKVKLLGLFMRQFCHYMEANGGILKTFIFFLSLNWHSWLTNANKSA